MVEHGAAVPDRGQGGIDLLHGRQKPHHRHDKDAECWNDRDQRAVAAQKHDENERQDDREAQRLENIAGHHGQDLATRLIARPAAGGLVEAVLIAVLEPHQLDILDPARRLLDKAETLAVELEHVRPKPRKRLAQPQIDEGIAAPHHAGGDEHDHRIEHQKEAEDRDGEDQRREQAHCRKDGGAYDLIHFVEHAAADLGAVALQEPAVGLAQIGLQQAGRDRVAAHRGKAHRGIGPERLDGEAHENCGKHAKRQKDLEGEGAGEAEGMIDPGQMRVLGDLLGIGEHAEQQQDRGNAKHLGEGHHDHHDHQKPEPFPLTRVEQIQYLPVDLGHDDVPLPGPCALLRLCPPMFLLAETGSNTMQIPATGRPGQAVLRDPRRRS